jgi:TrpR-related protein YerC/YecD
MNKFHSESVDTLVKGLLKLETEEECFAFLEDVCTIKELQDMAQRFDVALKLSDGFNYNQVSKETGASSATISRVNKCLMYGNNGYKTVIDRIKNEEK